jgi:hypothetical protein
MTSKGGVTISMKEEEEYKAHSRSEPCFKLAEDALTWREVDEEIVILDRRSWNYLGVNGSGVLLWKQLISGASPSQLVECLHDAYEIDVEVAQRDVEEFLKTLSAHSLLVEDGTRS